MYKVIVSLFLAVDNDAEACDAANEILRPQLRTYNAKSALIDYSVGSPQRIITADRRVITDCEHETHDDDHDD